MPKPQDRAELVPGTLDMLVLKTLTLGAFHGYAIAQRIEQLSEDVLRVEEGSLYPALQRMQLKGWVTSSWGLTSTNRRARFYKLTAAGRRQLAKEIAGYDRVSAAIARILRPV
jgi:PadR family transcriptional regulator, regulatory protein PadR